MKVVEEADRLYSAWTKASNENSGYQEAFDVMRAHDEPIFENAEWVKYGNVYVRWVYKYGEGLMSIALTMDNSLEF